MANNDEQCQQEHNPKQDPNPRAYAVTKTKTKNNAKTDNVTEKLTENVTNNYEN